MRLAFLIVTGILFFPPVFSHAASVDLSDMKASDSKPAAKTFPMNGEAASLYQQGMSAVQSKNFPAALQAFEQADRRQPEHPDILNMLAFSQRKLGKIDEALANYGKALQLKPEFPQAREYLGEAYLQAALYQIQILKSYGAAGKKESDQLVASFQKSAHKLGMAKQLQEGYE